MRSLRLSVAAVAVALTAAPFATAPASAMMCADGFEAVCFAIGTACQTLNELPKDLVACQLA